MPAPPLFRHLFLLRHLRPHPSTANSTTTNLLRSLSSSATATAAATTTAPASFSTSSSPPVPIHPLAPSISSALLNHPHTTPPTLEDFHHILPTTSLPPFNATLLSDVLHLSSPSLLPPTTVLPFFRFLVHRLHFSPSDRTLSLLLPFLLPSPPLLLDLLSEFPSSVGALTLNRLFLLLSDRPKESISLFLSLHSILPSPLHLPALSTAVSVLSSHAHASAAESLVRRAVPLGIFPDTPICHDLVRAWCLRGRPDEALRLISEIRRAAIPLGAPAYNALLDCVCKLARKRNPLTMPDEAQKILVEMETLGIPRDTETFRVLIYNLCKIRRTSDAVRLFDRMAEFGCSPDADTHLCLIRSLYQAARTSEGDDMLDRMWSAGFEAELTVKECYGFLKILCGIERLEHALKLFKLMRNKYKFKPGVRTYELLMERLCARNQVEKANGLFRKARAMGLPVVEKEYKVDPRYLKEESGEKKSKKKRLTLPEKILLKRKRLKKLRLSFVRKPRKKSAY